MARRMASARGESGGVGLDMVGLGSGGGFDGLSEMIATFGSVAQGLGQGFEGTGQGRVEGQAEEIAFGPSHHGAYGWLWAGKQAVVKDENDGRALGGARGRRIDAPELRAVVADVA